MARNHREPEATLVRPRSMRCLIVLSSVAPGKSHLPAKSSETGMPGLARPPGHRINLHYQSGWASPIIHHSICGQDWQRRTMDKVGVGSSCAACSSSRGHTTAWLTWAAGAMPPCRSPQGAAAGTMWSSKPTPPAGDSLRATSLDLLRPWTVSCCMYAPVTCANTPCLRCVR